MCKGGELISFSGEWEGDVSENCIVRDEIHSVDT